MFGEEYNEEYDYARLCRSKIGTTPTKERNQSGKHGRPNKPKMKKSTTATIHKPICKQ